MNHTFISLTFFILLGIITLSKSSPEEHSRQVISQELNITQELQKVITQGCLDLPPNQNFKNSTFFKGKWYLNRFYVLNFPRKNEIKSFCARKDHKVSLFEQPIQSVHLFGIGLNESGYEYYYEFNITDYVEFTDVLGKYYLFLASMGSPIIVIHIKITVLDTDYDNYSIEYICTRMGRIQAASTIQIYTRESYTVDEKVENSLKKFGLKIEDFKLSLDQSDPGNPYCNSRS